MQSFSFHFSNLFLQESYILKRQQEAQAWKEEVQTSNCAKDKHAIANNCIIQDFPCYKYQTI